MLSTLERYALSLYPNGLIDGITYEPYFGEIVWITTPDKSSHAVSTRMMMVDAESNRHSKEMNNIRSSIQKAKESMK